MINDGNSNAPLNFLLKMANNSTRKNTKDEPCLPPSLPEIWDLHILNPQWQELRAQNESTFYLRAAYFDNRCDKETFCFLNDLLYMI